MDAIIWPPSGRYILAVSGGVDSLTLLDVMAATAVVCGYDLIVAHFDHGLRADSHLDRELVEAAAARYKLPFATAAGALGQASEAVARAKRYEFLRRARHEQDAAGIITAHHRDDLIETSLLNLARGTGRRGLVPFAQGTILRPLIHVSRTQIMAYARENKLEWREDSTNDDTSNPRNFLRHELLPGAPAGWTARYARLIKELANLNERIDSSLASIGRWDDDTFLLDRQLVTELSLVELAEVIIMAARRLDPTAELDARLVLELALFSKTGRTGRRRPIRADIVIEIRRQEVVIYSANIGPR